MLKEYLEKIDEVIAKGPYKDTWESLSRYRVPGWYQDSKFGIFIHWGVYSVPAFGSEWYSRNMYMQGSKEYEHHIKTYGAHKDFGYKDFIPMFGAGVWRFFGEGPTKIKEGQFSDGEARRYTPQDIRFTVNNGCLYAAVLKYPADGEVTITSLREADASRLPLFAGIIKDVTALGFEEKPSFYRDGTGLHVKTGNVASEYPVVFKIVLD